MKIRYIKSEFELTGTPLIIGFGEDGAKYFGEKFDVYCEGTSGLCIYGDDVETGYFTVAIYINTDYSGVHVMKTVAHEATHAATFIWKEVGGDLDYEKNNEVLAYSIDNIVGKILEAHKIWRKYNPQSKS